MNNLKNNLAVFMFMLWAAASGTPLSNLVDNADSCEVENFRHIQSSRPQAITPHPVLPSTFVAGTNNGLVMFANSGSTGLTSDGEIFGVVTDGNGNIIYSLKAKRCIKKYILNNPSATSTWAGQCDGNGDIDGTMETARFSELFGLAVDDQKEKFYVMENRQQIRMIKPADNTVTKVVIGMNGVRAMAVDKSSGDLYFSADKALYKLAADGLAPPVLVAGTPGTSGDTDSTLLNSVFKEFDGLVYLTSERALIATQREAKIVRLIDLDNDAVKTVCTANSVESDTVDNCDVLRGPQDIIVYEDELYFCDDSFVRSISCPDSPSTTAATTAATVLMNGGAAENLVYEMVGEREANSMVLQKQSKETNCQGPLILQIPDVISLHYCSQACVARTTCECVKLDNNECLLHAGL